MKMIENLKNNIALYIEENKFSLTALLIALAIAVTFFTHGFITGLTKAETKQTTSEKSMYEIISEQDGEPWLVSLGKFTITAYCPCAACCGKTDGITATGVKATEGRTIAVDPQLIPYGTELVINGNTYIAEDTGGSVKGHKLDIFFNSHLEALEWGVQEHEVFIYE